MPAKIYWIAFITLLRKEIKRFLRIWVQTLLPPLVTMTLYFLIFGNLVGQRIGRIEGYSYMQYIAPGLIMMSIITAAYTNVVTYPEVSDKKVYPIRWLILLITVVAAELLCFALFMIKERSKGNGDPE